MKRNKGELLDLGRFSEPALMILVSLADGPKHGYAMSETSRD
jgi:DNA-binding PadR family transcriptional regulator